MTLDYHPSATFFFRMFDNFYSFDRTEKEWEELQVKMGELPETRPQEGSHNTTGRKRHSRAACQVGKQVKFECPSS